MANPAAIPARPSSQTIITRGGKTYVFETAEKARAFASQPLSDEEVQRGLQALQRFEGLRQRILARTGGRGVTEEDIEDALAAAKDH
jgi:hypothetical protein